MWWNGGFHRVADPLRHLLDGIASLGNPIGSPVDKVRVGLFRLRTLLQTFEQTLEEPETTTMQRLKVRCSCCPAASARACRPWGKPRGPWHNAALGLYPAPEATVSPALGGMEALRAATTQILFSMQP